jgi:hypothetical protein
MRLTVVGWRLHLWHGPGQDTDEYIVVGGSAGLYILQGETLHHGRGPAPVPGTLSMSDLKLAIAAA